mmetsp:Transcript_11392/g.23290  ORF Transcript_11392/g.23290 Transcript_11392/m.23290 type:complete len:638 (-) Transcript_11392:3385-5298(-)
MSTSLAEADAAVSALTKLLTDHPIPSPHRLYSYGTAGFRYPHHVLPPILVRIGLFAALRSASLGGEAVGIMITASHNPVNDNGIKLSDPDGGMLSPEGEIWAVRLANATTVREVFQVVRTMARTYGWTADDPFGTENPSAANRRKMVVHIGRDTRPHSASLAALAAEAARCLGATIVDHGVVTTPQLHHAVMHANPRRLPNAIPVRPNEDGYMEIMSRSYATLIGTATAIDDGAATANMHAHGRRVLTVDGACGVGYPKIRHLASMFQRMQLPGGVILHPVNAPGDGPLNDGCGAEHVQKNRLPPLVYPPSGDGGGGGGGRRGRNIPFDYAASLDGDADRVVFHYNTAGEGSDGSNGGTTGSGTFRLLDGDKIAVLVTQFIQEELHELQGVGLGRDIRCGIVQTAYANGAATAYVRNAVGADVVIAKTGVKFVHAAAHDNFDVGVYFEANGHGTVLFSPKFYRLLDMAETKVRGNDDRANIALQRLRVLPSLVNQAVGDAISDLLLVDAVLFLKGWSIQDWDRLYDDMPSRQCKVKVQDRSVIKTNNTETKAVAPSNLQPSLDAAMRALDNARRGVVAEPSSRCFVRPSGTENAVRVYAEASTQAGADSLASEAAALLHKLCGGVGDPPRAIVRSRI